MILRLLSPQANGEGAANAGNDAAPGADPSQAQHQQPTSAVGNDNNNTELLGGVSTSGPGPTSAAAEIAAFGSNLPPQLDAKNLPTEVSSIKIRIQKAQGVVESLPDVDRTVGEQEREIHDLEDKISRLKSVISDFGRRANNTGSEKAKAPGL